MGLSRDTLVRMVQNDSKCCYSGPCTAAPPLREKFKEEDSFFSPYFFLMEGGCRTQAIVILLQTTSG